MLFTCHAQALGIWHLKLARHLRISTSCKNAKIDFRGDFVMIFFIEDAVQVSCPTLEVLLGE